MNIAQALALRGKPDSYERQEAIWLLESFLQCSILNLKLFAERTLSVDVQQAYLAALARLEQGEPLAYILGSQPFWSLDLIVSRDTLVPRPDSESVVETVLSLALPNKTKMVDLGTGTGALALALASERPSWNVIATDIYPATLEVAKQNAHKHNLKNVQFFLGSWYAALSPQKFDLIVSNPPYIDPTDKHLQNLQYEPQRALTAGQQGMADLIHIVSEAPNWLEPKGWIVLEHGFDQAMAVRQLLQQHAFQSIRSVRDYGGNERVTLGQFVS